MSKTNQVPQYTSNRTQYSRSMELPSVNRGEKSVELVQTTVPIDISTPKAEDIFSVTTAIKCSIPISFPNATIGENLLVKYQSLVAVRKAQAQSQHDTYEAIFEFAELVWQAGYVVLGLVEPTGIGAAVWGYFHDISGDQYASVLSNLQEEIQNGFADPRVVHKIAVISGATTEAQDIRSVINTLPQMELSSRLTELVKRRNILVKVMGPNSISSTLVWDSVGYQVGYYYSLTILDMNIKAICDRMKGIDPNVPQLVVTGATIPPAADLSKVLPPGAIIDRFENPPKSKIVPILLGLLAASSFVL